MLQKIVYAGAKESFLEASRSLEEMADLEISRKEVERTTKRIGKERLAQRDSEVKAYRELPLPQKGSSPREQVPQIAAVGMDGGRYQRIADASDRKQSADAASGSGRWREYKAGCLLSLTGESFAEDPCPDVPASLLDPQRVAKRVGEIKSAANAEKGRPYDSEPAPNDEEPASVAPASAERQAESSGGSRSRRRPGAPTVLVRSVVASAATNLVFGLMLATAAWKRGFMAAKRKAFLSDGAPGNWTVWKRFFPRWTPILDFVHLMSYVYSAATAGQPETAGWNCYVAWITLAWRGQLAELLEALRRRAAQLGRPPADASSTDPRRVVHDALRYIESNQSRMHYDQYRRAGLPITTSRLESTVKQLNQRIKGTEKHWSRPGGEALLQLRADYLSDTNPMDAFWKRRQETATGQRSYSRAA